MESITRYNEKGTPYKTEMSKKEAMTLVHTMAGSFLIRASGPLLYPVNTKDRGETAWLIVERLLKHQDKDPDAERDRLKAQNELLKESLQKLRDSFIHDRNGSTKGNQAKTDIIKYNEDVRNALNFARETFWTIENGGPKA